MITTYALVFKRGDGKTKTLFSLDRNAAFRAFKIYTQSPVFQPVKLVKYCYDNNGENISASILATASKQRNIRQVFCAVRGALPFDYAAA